MTKLFIKPVTFDLALKLYCSGEVSNRAVKAMNMRADLDVCKGNNVSDCLFIYIHCSGYM